MREHLPRRCKDCGCLYAPTAKRGPVSEFCSRPCRLSYYYQQREPWTDEN
jgi:hypothetical protein